jgi:hypothetical protein
MADDVVSDRAHRDDRAHRASFNVVTQVSVYIVHVVTRRHC